MSEEALETEALAAWLTANVAGFAEPFAITKFPAGQSNPTYRIISAGGEMVLRR